MNQPFPRRALVSVSDKSQLAQFVRRLVELGFEIVSTGGTRRFLEEQGIAVIDVSAYTGFPEIMDGRVKTLHPKVHGGILGRPDLAEDAAAIKQHGIVPFELVVCTLYPFEQTIARDGVTIPEAIEQIDIGGPSMVRSAAKNHAYVGIVTDPAQYTRVLKELESGRLSEAFRRELARAAFEMTARYDRAIADYMATIVSSGDAVASTPAKASAFPGVLTLRLTKRMDLRYGENPHQQAAFYAEESFPPASLAAAEPLSGKELSYNNLLDLDAALCIAREFDQPAAVIIKHNNPCGCAVGSTLAEAFEKAYAGDPVSAFGCVIGLNRSLDVATAELMCLPDRFVEAVIAPGYDDAAFTLLTTRPKWKSNVRLVRCPAMCSGPITGFDYRRTTGGLLVQDRDQLPDATAEWKCVTRRRPTEAETADLHFGWKVCRHVKSNAIVYAHAGAVVGVGAGQMSRLDSSFIAAHKAGERAKGSVMASDAFFPFRDGVDAAAQAGVTAVIQPGGSRNDAEVIAACDEHGMAMIFTGRRHFKH